MIERTPEDEKRFHAEMQRLGPQVLCQACGVHGEHERCTGENTLGTAGCQCDGKCAQRIEHPEVPLLRIHVPTVHLNGTSKDGLLEQLYGARDACRAAVKALHDAAPHPRDYYTQEGKGFQNAVWEHVSRLHRLESVEKELAEILEAVADQNEAGAGTGANK